MANPKSRIETQKALSEASRRRKAAGLNQRAKRRRTKGYKEMEMWGAWFDLMRRQWRV